MPSPDWLNRNPNWRRRMSTPMCQSQAACDGNTLAPRHRERGICTTCWNKLHAAEKPPRPLKGSLPGARKP